jgi:stage V sporulation protein B
MIEQHTSLSEKFIKKGFWLYLFSFIIAPMGYIVKIIISWELTVSEVWILYGIISLIWLISAYNDLWMSASLNYFVPQFVTEKRYDRVKSILFFALFIQIFTSLLIALSLYLGADFIANNYFQTNAAKETLKIFAFYFIWINILQTLSGFYIAVQDTFNQKIIDFTRNIIVMFFVLYIFFWDLSSLVNYSYSWLIWLYIWLIISLYIFYNKYYKKYFKWEKIIFEKELIIRIVKYAWLVAIWASAWVILSQMDMQMIIYILWTTDAWYYTNYLSIIWIPFLFITPIFWMLFPIYSELYAKWEINKIKQIKQIFYKFFTAIWIAFNLLFFIFSEIIAFSLFWEKFITSWMILKYSILFLMFNFLLQINWNILSWIWKVKERVKIVFIAIVFNFFTNLILINYIWVYWAALATWIWWILIWLLWEYYLWKKYRVKFNYKFLFKNLFFMWFLSFFAYYFLVPIFNWLGRINSFSIMLLIWVIWFTLFWIINYKELKSFILEIKKIKNVRNS